eukprot:scaffold12729_cov19-Prasinocladus_malaysianus.AAC.1
MGNNLVANHRTGLTQGSVGVHIRTNRNLLCQLRQVYSSRVDAERRHDGRVRHWQALARRDTMLLARHIICACCGRSSNH